MKLKYKESKLKRKLLIKLLEKHLRPISRKSRPKRKLRRELRCKLPNKLLESKSLKLNRRPLSAKLVSKLPRKKFPEWTST